MEKWDVCDYGTQIKRGFPASTPRKQIRRERKWKIEGEDNDLIGGERRQS